MSDEAVLQQRRELERVWANPPGWGKLAALNHSAIGVRFMLTGMAFFVIGGLLAMLMRAQLALPQQNIIDAETYAQAFTMHGTLMLFLFALPALEGLAMYVIPKMIGARDLVFPRLSAFGYFCYLFGGVILLSSLAIDAAPATGWFMYTPLSDARYSPDAGADFWLIGITFVEISAISGGIELVVSILRSRTNGMSLRMMPIFCWYILAMALMILLGFPPLILASILLELERAAGWIFFDVRGGGDPLLWQHLFWLFGHPEVYILFLPAAGIVSTLIPVFTQQPILGYRWLVLSIILTGFISFGLWVHHMFTVGIPQLAQAFFSMASMLVAVPTAIQVFAWLAMLWHGNVSFRLPMLWVTGFLVIFVAGGLTGVMLALVPFNWQVHDTHFVVAHMHYVLVGGVVFPLIAGFYYWMPHMSGRMSSERLGRWAFWMTFIGFNLTFLIMHVTGLLGMPRRVYTYDAGFGWDTFNLVSSIGSFVMALGIAMLIVDLLLQARFGKRAPADPWHADTLEWAMPLPPPNYNFASLPTVHSRHPLWHQPDLPAQAHAGNLALADASHGRRETFGSDAAHGRAHQVIHLPSNSWIPLQTALLLAVVCIALLSKTYWLALLAGAAAALVVLRWCWLGGGHPEIARNANESSHPLPLHSRVTDGPERWGVAILLLSDASFYLSLLFGWLYSWTVAPQRSVPDSDDISLATMLIAGVLVSIATFNYTRTTQQLAHGNDQRLAQRLTATAVLGTVHVATVLYVLLHAGLTPSASIYDALQCFALIYGLVHCGIAVVLTLLQAARARLALISADIPGEPFALRTFWQYTLATFWITLVAFVLLPMAWLA